MNGFLIPKEFAKQICWLLILVIFRHKIILLDLFFHHKLEFLLLEHVLECFYQKQMLLRLWDMKNLLVCIFDLWKNLSYFDQIPNVDIRLDNLRLICHFLLCANYIRCLQNF